MLNSTECEPLKTGEPIPGEKELLGVNRILALDKEGRIQRRRRNLIDIQNRAKEEFNANLPITLAENLGLASLAFVENYHPDSGVFIYLGYENEKEGGLVSDCLGFIGLSRAPESFGRARLNPYKITLTGVNPQFGKLISAIYRAEYSPSVIVQQVGGRDVQVRMPDNPKPINWPTEEAYISVGDEFEFKQDIGLIEPYPYRTMADYQQGLITQAMVDKLREGNIHLLHIQRGIGSGSGFALARQPFYTGLYQVDKLAENFYADLSKDYLTASFGIRDLWGVTLPANIVSYG